MFTSTTTSRPRLHHRTRTHEQHPNPSDVLIAQFQFHWSIKDFAHQRPRRRVRKLRSTLEWVVRVTEADKARTPRMVAVDLVPWLTLQVTRHYRHPGCWVAQCPPILDTHILRAHELEDAKVEAQELVRQHVAFALLKVSR